MSFNPFAFILNQNKLIRPNYVDWKRNLDIVLTAEGYKYVLTEEHSDLSATNSPRLEKDRYKKWVEVDEMGTLLYFSFDVFSVYNII